jgi:hypothetical protein
MGVAWLHGVPWSNTATPRLRWRRAVDPDPDDTVTYTLLVNNQPRFNSGFFAFGLTDTFYAFKPEEALTNMETYYWKVRAFDAAGLYRDSPVGVFIVDYTTTGVGDSAPVTAALSAWPNPFNPALHVRVGVPPDWSHTRVDVYDTSGSLVRRLLETDEAGVWLEVEWDGRNDEGVPVGSGVYFVRATAGGASLVRKAVLLK